jgi:hypothetical protein
MNPVSKSFLAFFIPVIVVVVLGLSLMIYYAQERHNSTVERCALFDFKTVQLHSNGTWCLDKEGRLVHPNYLKK